MEAFDLRKDLIDACRRNERWAQNRLYQDYADAMYNVAFRMVQNEDDARDILQNSFIDVFRSIRKFKNQVTPGSWIKRIVINNSINHLKKKKLEFTDLSNVEPVENKRDEKESFDIRKIRSAIKRLPDGYRTVLTLYLIEGYDHLEISQILGISVATSKSQFSRAKAKLRELLSNNIYHLNHG